MPITACCFNSKGNIFAYTSSYDWSKVGIYLNAFLRKELVSNKLIFLFSKGHEFYNPQIKPKIFLRNCLEELKPRKK